MELKKSCFSRDGYIIRQQDTGSVPFGRLTSDVNGCGWIAAYNLLRASLCPVTWQEVRRDLTHLLPFRGELGVNAFVLQGYLRGKGCRLRSAVTLSGAEALVKDCRAGILLYSTGHSRHYVSFVREEDGRLRFFNTAPGKEEVIERFPAFYRRYVRFPVFWLFVTK